MLSIQERARNTIRGSIRWVYRYGISYSDRFIIIYPPLSLRQDKALLIDKRTKRNYSFGDPVAARLQAEFLHNEEGSNVPEDESR